MTLRFLSAQRFVAVLLASLMLASCSSTPLDSVTPTANSAQVDQAATNMLTAWPGEYGGVPQFQWLKEPLYLAALKPAVERGIEMHLAEIDEIASNPDAPTFANTVAALEKSGEALDAALVYWRVWSANESTPEFREVQKQVAPLLAEYNSAVTQNQALFKRVAAVQNSAEQKQQRQDLTPAQRRLLKQHYDEFSRNGATLEGESAERYAAIEKQLAQLYQRFSANMLADEEGYVTYLTKTQLGGLPDHFIAAAAEAAIERGHAGEWAVTNTRSSIDPFLTYSTQRSLREKVWRNFYARGDNRGEHDNLPLIPEILQLRHERVQLLGFDNYATWRLDNRMAKTPERADDLMMQLWPAAVAKVRQEVADMQAIADQESKTGASAITIEPWDYRFYADKVRQSKYALDSNEVMQYLQLDNLVSAMFFVAGELFGIEFSPLAVGSVPVANSNVRVWEVTSTVDGKHVGLWYLDPFARPGKGSGAWASTYRSRSTAVAGEQTVLVSNNSNFVKAPEGEAVLISWSDAETLFHEFGHALHALVADVEYPGQNWGVRDYTEFQSQLLERWLLTPPVVENFLRHHKTDEPIPAELVAKLKAAATFNQGFATTEYLASAIVDMKLHTTNPQGLDAARFERDTLKALGMPRQLVMRHRTPHFGHVFENEGYAAGYYGYIWSEVLTADAAEAFAESPGGFYDKEVARRMVENLFAPRNSVDPMEAYVKFRGRAPRVEALERARGFGDTN